MKQGKELKKLLLTVSAVIISALQLVACSDTEFSQKPPNFVKQDIAASKVDILFIVDNSGSMYTEQAKMANSFPQLINGMALNGLDYRIAITTTDVVSRTNNKKALGSLAAGALQDGYLIKFPDGNLFLDANSNNIEQQFRKTIQRKETLDCEAANFAPDKCPSSDERGIYAANLAVKRNEGGFFRSGSHVAFVFLSDEDVRGNALNNPPHLPELQPVYGDYPESLIESVYKDLGPSHTMSSHAIIIPNETTMTPDGRQTCLASQMYQEKNEYILGRVGTFYRSLSNPRNISRLDPTVMLDSYAPGKLLLGTVGSICATNYTAQLGSMLNVLVQDKNKYIAKADLDCTPENDTFKIEHCPSGVVCGYDPESNTVTFRPSLRPNQTAQVSYYCYK